MIYAVLGLITYMALISIVFIIADGLGGLNRKCKEWVEQGFRLIAGKRGGLFYVVNGRKRYI